MITELETYFTKGCGRCPRFATPACSVSLWRAEVSGLREICLGAGLTEALRWGQPCYRASDRNVAIIGAVKDGVRLGFFHAGLLRNPQALLEKAGPNTRTPDTVRFRDLADVLAKREKVLDLLREAKGFAEAGAKAPIRTAAPDLPVSLIEALAADPELSVAFDALTPGRQRSYVILLKSAKTDKTRDARIARSRDRILAGKGATER